MSIHGKEVLIIDDTADVRMLCRKIVENAGMGVTEASSVEEALRILKVGLPHLILLDLKMPGKSGFDFLAVRARIPTIAQIPVIVVSASTDMDSVHKAIDLGAVGYAIKPLTRAILIRKISNTLRAIDFQFYEFSLRDAPEVTCSLPAWVSHPSETGFCIGAAVKITPSTTVRLHSVQLRDLGLDSCVFVTEENPAMRGVSGFYYSRVNVIGLKRSITRALKVRGA
jgi:CheY-like chemotaxis protein